MVRMKLAVPASWISAAVPRAFAAAASSTRKVSTASRTWPGVRACVSRSCGSRDGHSSVTNAVAVATPCRGDRRSRCRRLAAAAVRRPSANGPSTGSAVAARPAQRCPRAAQNDRTAATTAAGRSESRSAAETGKPAGRHSRTSPGASGMRGIATGKSPRSSRAGAAGCQTRMRLIWRPSGRCCRAGSRTSGSANSAGSTDRSARARQAARSAPISWAVRSSTS